MIFVVVDICGCDSVTRVRKNALGAHKGAHFYQATPQGRLQRGGTHRKSHHHNRRGTNNRTIPTGTATKPVIARIGHNLKFEKFLGVVLGSRHDRIGMTPPTHGRGTGKCHSTVREWISGFPAIRAGETDGSIPSRRSAALSPLNIERVRATPRRAGIGVIGRPISFWSATETATVGTLMCTGA